MSVSINTNAIMAMQAVGEDLAQLRISAGLRQEDAAERLNVTRYTISKIERGKAFPTEKQLNTLLRVYEATAEKHAAIRAIIDQGRSFGRAWWEQPRFRSHIHGDSYRYFYIEDAAEQIFVHSGTYVPGLLQTREYTEAIVSFGQADESAEHREVFTEARMRRQDILTRRNPVALDALCLEAAVRAVVGGPDVMRRQLGHLLDSTKRPHVTLRVVPHSAGAPSISGAPFSIFDFPGDTNRAVVFQERTTGEILNEETADVRRARRKFANLARHALSPEETARYIGEIEKELS
ncbi:helix-turn-helix transcriptional regulator [Streptomyces sp. MP131-18]|uniref:helix-turn-helix domain-containing protein n=1 Tax=Streptomyces sp. MP131-18 TaxID=1857892 RepID=UPI00097CA1F7|nr:helix-turn-helix transcriptional regulator [Streptomyces sp. MP131-18]ONK14737.1 DNA-binding transcriptional repressor PuuR [Streptomyces sp. MP131-18]